MNPVLTYPEVISAIERDADRRKRLAELEQKLQVERQTLEREEASVSEEIISDEDQFSKSVEVVARHKVRIDHCERLIQKLKAEGAENFAAVGKAGTEALFKVAQAMFADAEMLAMEAQVHLAQFEALQEVKVSVIGMTKSELIRNRARSVMERSQRLNSELEKYGRDLVEESQRIEGFGLVQVEP